MSLIPPAAVIRARLYQRTRQGLSLAQWRGRLVFWCGAIAIGIVASGFTYISDYAQKSFTGLVALSPFLPLIICPVVLAGTAMLTAVFAPGAVGSGIPQAIAARVSQGRDERRFLLGPQIIIGKMLFTVMALFGGASIGREGPTVQIGAALLYLGATATGMSAEMSRSVILAGAAAGVAAAFNTPLAGIVFAIEEMARAFEHRYSGVVLTAIVLAGAASLSMLGNYSYFGFADGAYLLSRDWLAIGILGVIGGLMGGVFARLLAEGTRQLPTLYKKLRLPHPALFAGICGLVIALLGLATSGASFGSGYEQAKALLHNELTASWMFTAAKFVATLVSGLSGVPGGIFSPSLSVGAGLGASMQPWFPETPAAGIVLLGMTAYFAGVTQAPITAFIIVLEITGRQSLPVPLIASSVIAAAVSRLVCPVSLYHALARNFMTEEIAQPPREEAINPA